MCTHTKFYTCMYLHTHKMFTRGSFLLVSHAYEACMHYNLAIVFFKGFSLQNWPPDHTVSWVSIEDLVSAEIKELVTSEYRE